MMAVVRIIASSSAEEACTTERVVADDLSAAVNGLDGVEDGLVEVVDEDLPVPSSCRQHKGPKRGPAAAKQVPLTWLQLQDRSHLKQRQQQQQSKSSTIWTGIIPARASSGLFKGAVNEP